LAFSFSLSFYTANIGLFSLQNMFYSIFFL
jgi:hypothetical protein